MTTVKIGDLIDAASGDMLSAAAKIQKFFPGYNVTSIWDAILKCESIREQEYEAGTLIKLVNNYFEEECPTSSKLGHGERNVLWEAPTGLMGITMAGRDVLVGSYDFNPVEKKNYLYVSDENFIRTIALSIPCREAVYMPYVDPKTKNIFLACEDSGQVFAKNVHRSFDEIWKGRRGIHNGAFAVHRSKVDGRLWGLSGGEVKDLEGTTSFKFDGFYGKSFCELSYVDSPGEGPKLYVPGWFEKENKNGYLVYGDSRKWREGTSRTSGRFNFGFNNDSHTWILLPGTGDFSGGKHHSDSAALWAKNKGGHFRLPLDGKGLDYLNCGCFISETKAVVGGTTTWKSDRLGAKMFEVDLSNRTTKQLGEPFPDAEIRSMCWDSTRGRILASTKTQNRGCVYEVGVEI